MRASWALSAAYALRFARRPIAPSRLSPPSRVGVNEPVPDPNVTLPLLPMKKLL